MCRYAVVILCCFLWGLAGGNVHAEEVLTNHDVVDLIKAGLAKELVIEKIKSCENAFDLATKAMIQLKEQGVSDDIIALMLQEQKSRRNKVRARLELEIQHLAADRPEVRNAAFLYISRMGETAVSALQETLGHARQEMRIAAAWALARLDHKESARLIRNLLTDPVPEVRWAAADGLSLLKDELSLELARKAVTADLKPLDGYARLLGLFREAKAVGFLKLRLYEDGDPLVRSQCAWALGEIGLSETVPPLEDALLKDRSAVVRREAASALGKICAPESAGKLIKACMNDPEAREAILAALANFPPATAVPFLIFALNRHLNEAETRAALASLRKLTHQDFGADIAKWNQWWEKNRDAVEKEGGPSWRPEAEGGGRSEKNADNTPLWQTNEATAPPVNVGEAGHSRQEQNDGASPADENHDKHDHGEDGGEEGAKPEEKNKDGEKVGENAIFDSSPAPAMAELYRSAPPNHKDAADAYGAVNIPGIPSLPRRQGGMSEVKSSGRFLLAEAGGETPAESSPSAGQISLGEDAPAPALHPYAVTAESFEQIQLPDRGRQPDPPLSQQPQAAGKRTPAESNAAKSGAALEAGQSSRPRTFTADAYEQD